VARLIGRWCPFECFTKVPTENHFHCALGFLHPKTRVQLALLGPCSKTGRGGPFRQRHERASPSKRENARLHLADKPKASSHKIVVRRLLQRALPRASATLTGIRGLFQMDLHPLIELRAPHWLPTLLPHTISCSFDCAFALLFIFPSRYLFAIGLSSIFSFRRSLPPTLSQQSQASRLWTRGAYDEQKARTGLSPSAAPFSNETWCVVCSSAVAVIDYNSLRPFGSAAIPTLSCALFTRRY